MASSLFNLALPATLAMALFAAPAVQAEPSAHAPAETLAERQQRVALELEAEQLLVTLHQAPLEPELEPCINSGVSPSGRFASAELEVAVTRFGSGELTPYLGDSGYYRAFNAGRIALND